jgi:hypothetical protein
MRYGHPQQTQIVGCVPIGVSLVAANFTDEVLAPAHTKTAAARASLARIVRLHDFDGNPGDVGLTLDECAKLKEAPARVVPADRLRNVRPARDTGQVFETDPSTHLNRLLNNTFADDVVLRQGLRARISASLRVPSQIARPNTGRRGVLWSPR